MPCIICNVGDSNESNGLAEIRIKVRFSSLYSTFNRLRILLPAALALLLSGCSSSNELGIGGDYPPPKLPHAPVPVAATKVTRTKLNDDIVVGDRLELFVKEDPSYNNTYVVRERGDIILPQLGRIPVAGLSVSGAQERIELELEKRQLTSASVILDRVSRARPQVQASGTPGAGGVPTSAMIAPQQISVYMTGKVNRPGQHTLALPADHPLGAYEAILISGGISRFGDEQKVHIMRTGSDGKKHRIPINLRSIEKGKADDLAIGHGDIVVVPEKIFGF